MVTTKNRLIIIGVVIAGITISYLISVSVRHQAERVWLVTAEAEVARLNSLVRAELERTRAPLENFSVLYQSSDAVTKDEFFKVVQLQQIYYSEFSNRAIAFAAVQMNEAGSKEWRVKFTSESEGVLKEGADISMIPGVRKAVGFAVQHPYEIVGIPKFKTSKGKQVLPVLLAVKDAGQLGVLITLLDIKQVFSYLYTLIPRTFGLRMEFKSPDGTIIKENLYHETELSLAKVVDTIPFQFAFGNIETRLYWDVTESYSDGPDKLLANVVLYGGIIINVFIGIIITLLISRYERSKRNVKQKTKELRASEKQFHSLLESAPDAIIIISTEDEIVEINAFVTELFGYPDNELIGQNSKLLLPDCISSLYQSADYDDISQSRYGLHKIFESTGKRKNGSKFPLEVTTNLLNTQRGKLIICSVRDTTERVRVETELKQSQQRLSLAMQASKFIAWERELQTSEINVGAFYEEFLGYPPGELDNSVKSWFSVVHPDDLHDIKHEFDRQLFGNELEFRIQYRAYAKDGSIRWIEAFGKVTELNADGKPQRIMGIQHDITRRKQAELMAEERLRELEEFNQKAVGRELRMIELKRQINQLLEKLGQDATYEIIDE